MTPSRDTPDQPNDPVKEIPEEVRKNLEEQAPLPEPIPDPGPL